MALSISIVNSRIKQIIIVISSHFTDKYSRLYDIDIMFIQKEMEKAEAIAAKTAMGMTEGTVEEILEPAAKAEEGEQSTTSISSISDYHC